MTKRPLPVIDLGRTEFGFCRTRCECDGCRQGCRRIPGYLIPADLDRLRRQVLPGATLVSWAAEYLLASPGAIVARRGRAFRIPTLVPARRADGACVFLTGDGRCAVHTVAPYGCAFFDAHLEQTRADRRSLRGLAAVIDAWTVGNSYAVVWAMLAAAGHYAPAPETCGLPAPRVPARQ
jgi:Fe-S-cluster containining protein